MATTKPARLVPQGIKPAEVVEVRDEAPKPTKTGWVQPTLAESVEHDFKHADRKTLLMALDQAVGDEKRAQIQLQVLNRLLREKP